MKVSELDFGQLDIYYQMKGNAPQHTQSIRIQYVPKGELFLLGALLELKLSNLSLSLLCCALPAL